MFARRIVSLFFVAALSLALPTFAQQQASPTKIAIVNTATIFNNMQETKDLKQKMEGERKVLEGTDREKREKLRSLREARDQLKSDSPQYQERNNELLKAAIEYEAWGKLTQANVQREQKYQMKSLFEKIEAAVAEVSAQKGIDLVLVDQRPEIPEELDNIEANQLRAMINSRNIAYSTPRVDISNDVLAVLDSKYKATAMPQ